jgi:hypothetical protein
LLHVICLAACCGIFYDLAGAHGVMTQVSAKDFVFDAVRPPPLIKPPFLFKVIEDHIS